MQIGNSDLQPSAPSVLLIKHILSLHPIVYLRNTYTSFFGGKENAGGDTFS